MSGFTLWNRQPIDKWCAQHAPGNFVELDGLQTHYIARGSGAPVILIHGFFFDTHMWRANIDELARHFRVYALDLWGAGYSTRAPLDYGYPLFARQLGLFMDALALPAASLVGQSMGGGTIIEFAVSNRSRVERIVLVDAAGLPNPLPAVGKIANLPGVGEVMYALPGNFMRRFTLGNAFIHDPETITEDFFEKATRFHQIAGSSEVMLAITRKNFFDKLESRIGQLAGLDVPTLIIWGREERAIPLSTGRKMHAMLTGSQLAIIDRAGHCPMIDRPGRFNALVRGFLSDARQP
jgi:pimeloyl-ACP methyl ester carboxylesterase